MTPRRDEIGAHMSIAGGLHLALERGREVGCGAVQIFLKNQRRWAAKPLVADEVRAFGAARRATAIRHVFAHSSYLINLGNPDPALWSQAVAAFTDELERAEALGLSCVVIHPGSHMGAGLEAGIGRVTAALDESLARTAGYRVKIALENTAGAGNTIGRTFGELATLPCFVGCGVGSVASVGRTGRGTGCVTRSPDSQRFALRAGRGGPTSPVPLPVRPALAAGLGSRKPRTRRRMSNICVFSRRAF